MSELLDGGAQLEQELTPEPVMAPAMGSIVLHFAICGRDRALRHSGRILSSQFLGECGSGRGDPGQHREQCHSPALDPAGEPECAGDGDAEPGAGAAGTQGQAGRRTRPRFRSRENKRSRSRRRRRGRPRASRTPVQNNRANYGEQSGSSMPHAMQPQLFKRSDDR